MTNKIPDIFEDIDTAGINEVCVEVKADFMNQYCQSSKNVAYSITIPTEELKKIN